jgi:hypothetical protein
MRSSDSSGPSPAAREASVYRARSRFTASGANMWPLAQLPDSVDGICTVARAQTIHHNLLGYYRITPAKRDSLVRVRPPRLEELLAALRRIPPGDLDPERPPTARLLGACVQESYFLAGLLRSRGFATRVRAGYFREIMNNPGVTLPFWRSALAARGMDEAERLRDPDTWKHEVDELTSRQIRCDHHIEHWLCEVWDAQSARWELLDANTDFLRAHSGIEVPFRLPARFFEFAWEAWLRMRLEPGYQPDQHAEEPQDGRSHIRSQMLSDFYSLLNHDAAGTAEPSDSLRAFVKGRTFAELSSTELRDLDSLAWTLSGPASVDQLRRLYEHSPTLRDPVIEQDPHVLVRPRP